MRTGLLALFLHQFLETRFIDREPQFPGHVGYDIDREPVCVVELEDERAGNGRYLFFLEPRDFILKEPEPVIEGLAEALLLVHDDLGDEAAVIHQFGIGIVHGLHDRDSHLAEKRFIQAEKPAVSQGAPDDPPQHVTPSFIAGQGAVTYKERGRAAVIGDDFDGDVLFRGGPVPVAGEFRDLVPHGGEKIGIVVGRHLLENGGDPFEPHSGIDARLGQRHQRAVIEPVELHENEVPKFEIPVAVTSGPAVGASASHRRPLVDQDFRTRTAWPGITHRPEIVLCGEGEDAVLGKIARPVLAGLFVRPEVHVAVAFVNSGVELVFRKSHNAGQEFPGIGDRVLFEVVTERKVPEHLEESVMAGGPADVFQIVVLAAGAHAFLTRCRAGIGPFLLTQKSPFELHHSRIGEQQSGVVVRNDGRTLDNRMAPLIEELQKCLPNFTRFH